MTSTKLLSLFAGKKQITGAGWLLPIALLVALTGCSFSLTGDVTPPPGYRPFIATQTSTPLPSDGTVTTTPAPLPTSSAPDSITLNGAIIFPAGVTQPAGMQVVLHGFIDNQSTDLATTDVLADGTFQFNEVKPVSGQTLYATTSYQGEDFISDVLHSDAIQPGIAYPITINIYKLTQDISVLSIERLHIFIQPDTAETFNILELFVVANPTDQMLVAKDRTQPVLWFELPLSATNVTFDTGMDPFFVVNGNKVGYLPSIEPGSQNQILFSYSLPYKPRPVFIFGAPSQKLMIPVPLAVKSAIVMIPEVGVQVKSSQLCASGTRAMGDTAIRLYTSCGIDKGKALKMTLSGILGSKTTNSEPMVNLAVGLAVLAAAVAVGVLAYRRYAGAAQSDPQPVETQGAILDAILALDDDFAARKPEAADIKAAYQERRAELLAKLRLVLAVPLEHKD